MKLQQSKRKNCDPDLAIKNTLSNEKLKNELLVSELGLRLKTFYIVRSCEEDGRGLGREISARTRETVPHPVIRSFGNLRKMDARLAG